MRTTAINSRTTTQLSSKIVPWAAYTGAIVDESLGLEPLLLVLLALLLLFLSRDQMLELSFVSTRLQASLVWMYRRIIIESSTMLTVQLKTAAQDQHTLENRVQ